MSNIILRGKEVLTTNPGGKRCRVCGGLIITPMLIKAGYSYRHPSNRCIPVDHRKKTPRIKVTGKFRPREKKPSAG